MKWTYYLISLGWLLLLAVIPSTAKAVQSAQKIKTFVCDFSEPHEVKVRLLSIVQPDPVPGPKPMADPRENSKPRLL